VQRREPHRAVAEQVEQDRPLSAHPQYGDQRAVLGVVAGATVIILWITSNRREDKPK